MTAAGFSFLGWDNVGVVCSCALRMCVITCMWLLSVYIKVLLRMPSV